MHGRRMAQEGRLLHEHRLRLHGLLHVCGPPASALPAAIPAPRPVSRSCPRLRSGLLLRRRRRRRRRRGHLAAHVRMATGLAVIAAAASPDALAAIALGGADRGAEDLAGLAVASPFFPTPPPQRGIAALLGAVARASACWLTCGAMRASVASAISIAIATMLRFLIPGAGRPRAARSAAACTFVPRHQGRRRRWPASAHAAADIWRALFLRPAAPRAVVTPLH
mmetsp:Transcript_128241/g.369331  ORF Transcript_128241/g.369331 Transcript_128241/m.369331 type:complete len:224 (+) Transcript_128241:182-853(+)